jgi:hypothetical protein
MYIHFSTNNLIRKTGWTANYLSTISNTERIDPTKRAWYCYPNPGNGIYQLRSLNDFQEALSIKVYDILGNIVQNLHSTEMLSNNTTLDISHLPNGIYYLNIAGSIQNEIIKLTKI